MYNPTCMVYIHVNKYLDYINIDLFYKVELSNVSFNIIFL